MSDVQPGIYRHFTGAVYDVIGVSSDSLDQSKVVVYKCTDGKLRHRPYDTFVKTRGGEPIFVRMNDQRVGRGLFHAAQRRRLKHLAKKL